MIRRKSWAEWFPLPKREPMGFRAPSNPKRRLYGYDIETAEDEIAWKAAADGNHIMTLQWLIDKAASRGR